MSIIKKLSVKYSDLPVTVKASFVYFCVSVIQKGLGFITSPIFTRLLTSAEYGRVSVFYSTEQLIGTVAMFCLSSGCFDIGMQDFKKDRESFLFSILILSNFITIVTGIGVFVLYPVIGPQINISPNLMIVMFINFFFSPALTFWTRRERFEFRYKMSGAITIASAILSTITAIAAIIKIPNARVEARIVGTYTPLIIIYVCFWGYLALKSKIKINFSYIKFAFLFNLPLIPHYLSAYILGSSDRLMIASLCGDSQAAYYGLANNVVIIGSVVWSSIYVSLVPYVLDKYEQKDYKRVSGTVLPILTLFAIMCMGIILVAPEIVGILGTEEYKEAIFVIPPIIGGLFFQALYNVFGNILYYFKKPQYVMCASITTAILNVVLNYIFIPVFGYIAAGYTTLFCYFLQALIDYYVARRIVKQDIYDMKFLRKLITIVIFVSLLSNILYLSNIMRAVGIFVVLAVLYRKRDILKQIVLLRKH